MNDITRGMERTGMQTNEEKRRKVEKMRRDKRKRAMMEEREERKKEEDPEKAREMQQKYDREMGGQTGGAPIGLLKF